MAEFISALRWAKNMLLHVFQDQDDKSETRSVTGRIPKSRPDLCYHIRVPMIAEAACPMC